MLKVQGHIGLHSFETIGLQRERERGKKGGRKKLKNKTEEFIHLPLPCWDYKGTLPYQLTFSCLGSKLRFVKQVKATTKLLEMAQQT